MYMGNVTLKGKGKYIKDVPGDVPLQFGKAIWENEFKKVANRQRELHLIVQSLLLHAVCIAGR